MKTLVIDVGGTHVKALATGRRGPIKIDSGSRMTAKKMVSEILKATADWKYEVVSIGYPGPVIQGLPLKEPHNLGKGWVGFNFNKAFGRPVKIINDAAMQALGSYQGGRMLFLGLGTGLGSALIVEGVLEPMELAHLPYRDGKTYEEFLGLPALEKHGKKKWAKHLQEIVTALKNAFQADYIVLGGGNARLVADKIPEGARLGGNENAFLGGFRLWMKAYNRPTAHRFTH